MPDDIVARLRQLDEELVEDEDVCADFSCVEKAADEIERLRAERDEARRRVCENAIQHGRVYRRVGRDSVRCETAKEVAEMMGWDCFKDGADA